MMMYFLQHKEVWNSYAEDMDLILEQQNKSNDPKNFKIFDEKQPFIEAKEYCRRLRMNIPLVTSKEMLEKLSDNYSRRTLGGFWIQVK